MAKNLVDISATGIIPVDKSQGMSSFDIIRKLRKILNIRKIGHAGTLDPIATGLVICCAGKATKRCNEFLNLPKEYTGTITIGGVTASYDAETPVTDIKDFSHVTIDLIEKQKATLTGQIQQIPPMYSAKKVDGERLYKKARKGEVVERKACDILVDKFEITRFENNEVDFLIQCSKGTYIRSLAHDLGQLLDCGGYISALRRTAIGNIRVEDSWTLQELGQLLGEAH